MRTLEFIQSMHQAKTRDPQSVLERRDLDAEAIRRGYPNWHQAWQRMVMQSTSGSLLGVGRFALGLLIALAIALLMSSCATTGPAGASSLDSIQLDGKGDLRVAGTVLGVKVTLDRVASPSEASREGVAGDNK